MTTVHFNGKGIWLIQYKKLISSYNKTNMTIKFLSLSKQYMINHIKFDCCQILPIIPVPLIAAINKCHYVITIPISLRTSNYDLLNKCFSKQSLFFCIVSITELTLINILIFNFMHISYWKTKIICRTHETFGRKKTVNYFIIILLDKYQDLSITFAVKEYSNINLIKFSTKRKV